MGSFSSPGWHVLYVQYKHEKKVNHILESKGLLTFLPLIKTMSLWKDRKKKVIKPLFPCYVFVNIESKSDFYKAQKVNGVVKYLQFGGAVAKVKPTEIEVLKQLLGNPDISDVNVLPCPLSVGDVMTIQYGPLKGMECVIERIKNQYKIFVKIVSIKYCISACLPMTYFEPSVCN